MRAREPDEQGYVDRDGVKVGLRGVRQTATPTVVFVPVDAIVHSRAWKAQVPYLARTCRVVTIDPRGNGRSDRPIDPAAYGDLHVRRRHDRRAGRARTSSGRCSSGSAQSAWRALVVRGAPPGPGAGVFAIAPWRTRHARRRTRCARRRSTASTSAAPTTAAGQRSTGTTGCATGPASPTSSSTRSCREPHSSKVVEDMVAYACETTPEVQLADRDGESCPGRADRGRGAAAQRQLPRRSSCTAQTDRCQPYARGANVPS